MTKLCADPRNSPAQRDLPAVQRHSPRLEYAVSHRPVPPPEDSGYSFGIRRPDARNSDHSANFDRLLCALRSPPPQVS
jgi:hypothetical protein